MKLRLLFVVTSLVFILAACAESSNQSIQVDISKIEVVDPSTDEKISTITDPTFMEDLKSELMNSARNKVSNDGFAESDYLLELHNEEGEKVAELKYFNEPLKVDGIPGRYVFNGYHFQSMMELPQLKISEDIAK